ncbi:MAG: glycerophosphodiester phosphodiesterase [Thermomicrobiales bacterium]
MRNRVALEAPSYPRSPRHSALRTPHSAFMKIAHRGAPTVAPGNTRAALVAALALGVDLIEVDLHATADGHLVLWHDPTMPSGKSKVTIARQTLASLRQLDLGQGERVIELRDAMELARDRAGLLIDLKAGGLAQGIAATARACAFERLAVCGHYWSTLRQLRALIPTAAVAFTINRSWQRVAAWPYLRRGDAHAVTINYRQLNHARVAQYRALNLAVIAWTVDDPTLMRRLIALGVDGITSNRPELFATLES